MNEKEKQDPKPPRQSPGRPQARNPLTRLPKPRKSQTRRLMAEGLARLMEREDFEEITVTQICQEAQVVRQTYYRNYENKRQILEGYLRDLILDYQETWPPSATDMEENLRNLYAHLPFPKTLLELLSRQGLFFLVEEACFQMIPEMFTPRPPAGLSHIPCFSRYYAAMIASAITGILRLWTQGGFQERPEELAAMSIAYFQGAGKEGGASDS